MFEKALFEVEMRKDMYEFFTEMEKVMLDNYAKKGDSYKTMSVEQHREGFFDELDELCNVRTEIDEMEELVDISNRCWMLWNALKKEINGGI